MKKGCALTAGVWLALVALYGSLAWPRVEHQLMPAAIIGVLGGTITGIFIGAVIGLFTGGAERAAFRRAAACEARADGRLEAASGPIRPVGAPLEAPFSGKPCVAYEYDVKPAARSADAPQKSAFAGVGLCPSVIDDPRGPARLLGWSVLDEFGDAGGIDRNRAEAYLRQQPFEDLPILKMLSAFAELAADDDGAIRRDFRIGGSDPAAEGRSFSEKRVAPGTVVTLLGVWDEAKQGFTPGRKVSINRLVPGDLAKVERATTKKARSSFYAALFFFLVLHGVFLGPMWFLSGRHLKRQEAQERAQASESVWDERDCEKLKALLAKGADPNARNQGRNALHNAAREGSVPCVEALLAAGARLEEKDENGDTPFDEAIMAGREDTAAALRKAGAKDFRVTEGRGAYQVTNDSEPYGVVKEYLAAVQAGDFDTMARLVPGAHSSYMKEHRDELLPLWQQIRPAEPELVNGWMTDDAATILVRGLSQGRERVVQYHLQKTLEGWRIFREWFPQDR